MKKLLITSAMLSVVAIVAGPALADGRSTIQLVRMADGTRLAGVDLVFGEQVTFEVSTSRTSYPWVQNRCWQDGRLVYEEWHGFWPGYHRDPIYTLGPTPSWDGGSATCEGRLVRQANGKVQTLATTKYEVVG